MINSVNYASREAYQVYVAYIAMKKHFTDKKYDYHLYKKKVRASYDKFQTRKDVFYFNKIQKRRDWEQILLANILDNPNKWIGEIADDEGKNIYLKWKSKVDGLLYNFEVDMAKLKDDFQENFVVVNGDYPYVLELFMQKEISLETFTILSHVTKVLPYWEEKVLDKIIACDIFVKSKKYHPFLDYDEKKFRKIIENRFF